MKSNKYISRAKQNIAGLLDRLSILLGRTMPIRALGKTYTIKPFAIAGGILSAAILLAALGAILSSFMGARPIDISFDAGSPYSIITEGRHAVLYNNRGATGINSVGKQKWRIDTALSEPIAEAAGDYLLLADLSGNHYAASYKNGDLQHEYRLGSDIISAKITRDGCVAIASDTDGYKGRVTVFNKRGRELYVWNSGSGYITDIALTEGGRYLAVAQLISDGAEAGCKIQFIDTRRGENIGAADYEGIVAVNIEFAGQNELLVVSDDHIFGLNRRGGELFSISLQGKSPSLYKIGDNIIAVAAVDSRGAQTIEIYSMSGKPLGTYTADSDIRAMSLSGTSLITAQQKGIVRINKRGKEKSVMPIGHDVKSIGYFSDSRAVIIGSAQAETIKIK